VPYGQDTTVSVVRKQPASLQSDQILGVKVVGSGIGARASVMHVKRIVTKYTVKNNSRRTIPQFYIDHTASALCGGFEIVTKENAVKAVVGFSRYQFRLTPQTEVEFEVIEEAKFEETIAGEYKVRDFLLGKSSLESVLSADVLASLEAIVQLHEEIKVLKRCESPRHLNQTEWLAVQESLRDLTARESVNPALKKLFELRESLSAVAKRMTAVQTRERKVFENQERIRNNIISMEKVQSSGDLLKRYMQDFERDEDDLRAMRTELENCEEERARLDTSINQQEISICAIAKKERERLEITA